jgi:hypothetical protein
MSQADFKTPIEPLHTPSIRVGSIGVFAREVKENFAALKNLYITGSYIDKRQ